MGMHGWSLRGALWLACGLLPAPALAGGIQGKVMLAGAPLAPKKVDVTIDQYLCGTEKDANDLIVSPRNEIANAVAWLEDPPSNAAWPPGSDKAMIDQRGCVFVPRIVVVAAGGTVDFLNNDRLLHNIHSTPKLNASFNRTQPKNRTIPVTFAKPEIVRIDCDLHSWMTAWVVVAAHPYYAVTKGDGQFFFDNVPPGPFRLRVWHERLGTVAIDGRVPDKGNASVNVEMTAR